MSWDKTEGGDFGHSSRLENFIRGLNIELAGERDRQAKSEAEVERLRLMVKSITGGLDECMETVQFLETENAKLRAVVEAAKVYVMEHDKIPNLRTLDEWIIIVAAIRNALAELDEEGER